ncbi:MGDG synthase family glycosyltransferase [Streptomyces chiangmaiensis]|uniref:Galactosyldiacylglycerol synthase n=1 Tax=Streptomyces chiangmaiensis TaxID=766497 RepID=A0ABU7FCR6_9ACTN|nr:galactosyldiacylglycerol synthase [Streptomyces chiangmaiensis]MED7821848.1 galactosyldiacylglycerol synthase [Streptomyces chiangmaiensis]
MSEAAHPGARPGHESRRILIVSASMGAGHDTVALELARRARDRGHEAHIVDVLGLLPHGLGTGLRRGYRSSVRHFPWAYAALHRVLLRRGTGRRPSGVPLARLAGDRLAELAARTGADVVVPVFHLGAQLTGHLRSLGRLRMPSVVFLIDFAVHRQWLHPGNDRYLCLTDEAAAEVRQDITTPAEVTGPVVAPEFLAPGPTAALWARQFDRLAPGLPPVLLSAGAWGTGTRLPATARLLAGHGYLPVVLCGRNERLQGSLTAVPGALALGWVADMAGLMHAAGALVDNAAGQTAVQALAAGLPVVGYRPLPGHGAEGVRRMAALGIADLAADETDLLASLDRLTTVGPDRRCRVAHGRSLFKGDVLTRLEELLDVTVG